MKTIATTIKADVVLYQDGTVEVITDAAPHATGTPAVVPLDEIGAFQVRRCFTPGELSEYGLRMNGTAAGYSFYYDSGERAGYEWVQQMFRRGELDRIGDLSFDWDARRQQARWSANDIAAPGLTDTTLNAIIQGFCNGFSLAICAAFGKVPNWSETYNRHKRLADNADIPNEDPARI